MPLSDLKARRRARSLRVVLDALEDRKLMAYNLMGAQWSQPIRVTYSIMPDGTNVGGVASNLQQTFNSNPATAASWRNLIQKAAAAWEFYANVQLVQVADNGSPEGTAGYQQNDGRFGDIRIGGYAQQSNQLGFALAPPPFNGGTAAGDIFINTAQSWNTNGAAYDFFSVISHEFGHALGLGHATTSASIMYPVYTGAKTSFATDDRNGIAAIYDAPDKDAFDADAANNSAATSSDITSLLSTTAQISIPNLSTHAYNDVDWYQVTVPANTSGTVTVKVQGTGLSSIVPAVQVWNQGATTLLGSDTSQTAYSSTAAVTIRGVTPGQVLKIKASPNLTTFGAIGTYGLQVNLGSGSQAPIAPPDTTVASQADQNPSSYAEGTGFWPVLLASLGHVDIPELVQVGTTMRAYGDTMEAPVRPAELFTPTSFVDVPWLLVQQASELAGQAPGKAGAARRTDRPVRD